MNRFRKRTLFPLMAMLLLAAADGPRWRAGDWPCFIDCNTCRASVFGPEPRGRQRSGCFHP